MFVFGVFGWYWPSGVILPSWAFFWGFLFVVGAGCFVDVVAVVYVS